MHRVGGNRCVGTKQRNGLADLKVLGIRPRGDDYLSTGNNGIDCVLNLLIWKVDISVGITPKNSQNCLPKSSEEIQYKVIVIGQGNQIELRIA